MTRFLNLPNPVATLDADVIQAVQNLQRALRALRQAEKLYIAEVRTGCRETAAGWAVLERLARAKSAALIRANTRANRALTARADLDAVLLS